MNPDEIMRRKIPHHRRVKSLNNLHKKKNKIKENRNVDTAQIP